MDKFKKQVLDPARESEEFIKQTGGLPEIWAAAENLCLALDNTDREIATAVMASRFPRIASDNMLTLIDGSSLSPGTLQAIKKEGEAGYKRESLAFAARRIRTELMSLINQLVEVRCDLIVAQTE